MPSLVGLHDSYFTSIRSWYCLSKLLPTIASDTRVWDIVDEDIPCGVISDSVLIDFA